MAACAAWLALAPGAPAAAQASDAERFGAREAVQQIALSPDGTRVVYLAPGKGAETRVYVASINAGAPKLILTSSGNPDELSDCHWSSQKRIVCRVRFQMSELAGEVGYSRILSIDDDGGDMKQLTARTSETSLYVTQRGGEVIDWLPDEDGAVLMTRSFVPERTIGTMLAETREGYGVERVDTRNLRRSLVESPRRTAVTFLTDGRGAVRVMGLAEYQQGYSTGVVRYLYRKAGSRDWLSLGSADESAGGSGFVPVAVDPDLDAAYGFETLNGRSALYRIKLDGTLSRELVSSRGDVDIDGLIRIGRRARVVGASFATEKREAQFFDPAIKSIATALQKALPGLPLVRIVDSSTDENRLLLWAGSDTDPGRYYVFDRKERKLQEIMLSRPELEGAKLAEVKPVRFKAADGTEIPAYLTLPPGSNGKGLPAIVMPHGGPGARDEWGFDWFAQFLAARGYAVLQPNFRGSAGYGEDWFAGNGFKSWRIAIGDVSDGGRWLVQQGIAAPDKLAILGWSYGGYAALQANVADPALFKAVVAIAPVTDLGRLKQDARYFTNYRLVQDFVGSGPHIDEGSPARNAEKIAAPVLLFHGDRDANVDVTQSRLMADRLRAAGKQVDYVEFDGLDHQLEDAEARTTMLERVDGFLRKAMALGAAK